MDLDKRNEPTVEAQDVLDFWYRELTPKQWWKRDDAVDGEITSRFAALYERLAGKVPQVWLASPRGRLAAVIVLDQFPRNMFRGNPRSFATDAKALEIASGTIATGCDVMLSQSERTFLYMPYQHSEEREVQARSVVLFQKLDDLAQLDFALRHKEIIDRFGRFPHRNKVLGRATTPREEEFLKNPGLF